jgi:hypothetical protein
MLKHEVPFIIVSRWHSHMMTTITMDIYGHQLPSMQAEAAEMIEELVMQENCNEINK